MVHGIKDRKCPLCKSADDSQYHLLTCPSLPKHQEPAPHLIDVSHSRPVSPSKNSTPDSWDFSEFDPLTNKNTDNITEALIDE